MLDQLRRIEAEQPLARPQLSGRVLFDMVFQMIRNEHGVRIEDLIAILASTGGYSCLLAALGTDIGDGVSPAGTLTVMTGKDGYRYLFGDLPNRYLIESNLALLSLTLGAARSCGGAVSLEMVHDTMAHVARSVGGDSFGQPRLPPQHRPSDLPINYVRYFWPKILDGLKLYEVLPTQWPAALGFALQHAIDAGKAAIDPTLAAQIAVECAVPMAKLDPARIA